MHEYARDSRLVDDEKKCSLCKPEVHPTTASMFQEVSFKTHEETFRPAWNWCGFKMLRILKVFRLEVGNFELFKMVLCLYAINVGYWKDIFWNIM